MRDSVLRRTASWLLTIALLAGMLPQIAAPARADQDMPKTQELQAQFYDFCALSTGDLTQEFVNSITYADSEAAGSAPWAFGGYSKTKEETGSGNYYFRYIVKGNGLVPSYFLDEASLKIKVMHSGLYTVQVGIWGASGCIPDVVFSLYELDENGAAAQEPLTAATVDPAMHYTGTDVQIPLSPGQVPLQEGKEYLLRCTQTAQAGNRGYYLKNLTLEPAAEVHPKNLYYAFDKAYAGDQSVTYAQTITYNKTTVKAPGELNPDIYSDPWAYHSFEGPAGGFVRYIANEQDLGLQLYPVGSTATVKIKVSASGSYLPRATFYGRKSLSGISDIALCRLTPAGEIGERLAFRSGIHTDAIQGPIVISLSEQPLELEAGEYALSWSVTGKGAGANNIQSYLQRFALLLTGESEERARGMYYDFHALYRETSEEYAASITYAMTGPKCDPWEYYSVERVPTGGVNSYFKYNTPAYGLGIYYAGTVGNIKIRVPQSGDFTVHAGILRTGDDTSNIRLSLHALEGDTIQEKALASASFNTVQAPKQQETQIALGDQPVNLPAGEYILRLEVVGNSSFTYLNNLTLGFCRGPAKNTVYDIKALSTEEDHTQEFADSIRYSATESAGSAPWAMYGWFARNGGFRYTERDMGLQLSGGNATGAIKLQVPASGTYLVDVGIHGVGSAANPLEIGLYPMRADGSLANTPICRASVDTADYADREGRILLGDSPVTIPGGDYALVCMNSGSGAWHLQELALLCLELNIQAQPFAAAIGGQSEQRVQVMSADGEPVELTQARVSVTVSDPAIADLKVVPEKKQLLLQLTGKTFGETEAQIRVIAQDGRAGITHVKLWVNPAGVIVAKDLRYSFHKLCLWRAGEGDKNTGIDVKTVTSFGQTTSGDPNEINPASTEVTAPWRYVNTTGSQLRYADSDYGLFFGYEPAELTFQIRVTESGIYRAVSENMTWPSGAFMKLFLAPEGADDPTADAFLLGAVDTYSAAQIKQTENSLKLLSLEAGDYTLTYRLEGKNLSVKAPGQVGIGAFTLKGMDRTSLHTLSIQGPGLLKKGETGSYNVCVKESDGVTSHVVPSSIRVQSTVDGVLKTRVESNADQTQYTIHADALAAGNTTLIVTADTGGVECIQTIPVSVVDEQATASRDYRYLFLKSVPVGMQLSQVDSFSKTIAGSPDELRPGSGTDPWCFASQDCSDFWYVTDSWGAVMGVNTGSKAAIKIRLPESGFFRPEMPYQSGNQCGIVRLYIAPEDAEDPTAPAYSIGVKDTFAESSTYTRAAFRSRYLSAGDYIVTWEIIGSDPRITDTARLWFSGIELIRIDGYPKMTVSAETVAPLKLGNSARTRLSVEVADGTAEDLQSAEFLIEADRGGIVSAQADRDESGNSGITITGMQAGQTTLTVSVQMNGDERSRFTIPVEVIKPGTLASFAIALEGSTDNRIVLRGNNAAGYCVSRILYDEDNERISELSAQLQNAIFTFQSSDADIASVDAWGVITPHAQGRTTISATVAIGGISKSAEMELTVVEGKSAPSFFTEEKMRNSVENAHRYDWARSIQSSSIKRAEPYLNLEETLWNSVTTQELPRSYYVGYRVDPEAGLCRYCGANIAAQFGSLCAWNTDALTSPWKVQCPACRRQFPSNDFQSFYQLGIDEHGNFRYTLAKEENQKLIDAGQKGYLVNILYPEKDQALGIQGWGVDDGYGYDTGNIYPNGAPEVHTYISFYNHEAIWHEGLISKAVIALREAYLNTGDARYGRVGAILTDRIADVYPDMGTQPYRWQMAATQSYAPKGKTVDLIWENQYAQTWALAYDAFFPMYDDPYVIRFLASKADRYALPNPKKTADQIRANCENNILREIFRCAQNGNLNGNFGMTHSAVAAAAVVLDTMPESRDMIDWLFQDGESKVLYSSSASFQPDLITGGSIQRRLIDNVDRDGISDEISPMYADYWTGGLVNVVELLQGYQGYPEMDLYKNPRFLKMLSAMYPLTMSRTSTVQIGDAGAVAGKDLYLGSNRIVPAYQNTKLPLFGQMLYYSNGNKVEGLHYDIYTKDPESLEDEIRQVIATCGEYDFDQSSLLTGYGFAALRGGTKYDTLGGGMDTQHTYWMSFTRGGSHDHLDGLNLGIEAYGLNIAPELGYPHKVIGDLYANWGKATVSHNTVVVDGKSQTRPQAPGTPLHFDDAGYVKLMDASAEERYPSTDAYRRTVVSIEAGDDISYAVDFFRIKGGNEHLYSFHALTGQRPQIADAEGNSLIPTPQTDAQGNFIGSYAGANIAFETEGITSGFSYLKNVERLKDPGRQFSVEFPIQDFRRTLKNDRELYLRLTAANDFPMDEVAIADGKPAQASGNPESLKYMLVKRTGSNLDTLFTTVLEPYDRSRYIDSIEQVTVIETTGESEQTGTAKAVKVTLKSGRIDYIVYAENNQTEYLVDGLFKFQGFVGVLSLQDEQVIYSYMSEGSHIGELAGEAAVTGTVQSFSRSFSSENTITVSLDQKIDPARLVDKIIRIDNQSTQNAVYRILAATLDEDGNVLLDIGDISLIRQVETADAGHYTYVYNIDHGQRFSIPLSIVDDNRPIFEPVGRRLAMAGSPLTIPVHAESPLQKTLTYQSTLLPRGASFDPDTQVLRWTPDSSQIGRHVVGISASDGALSSSLYFEIQVYQGSHSGGSGTVTDRPEQEEPEKNPVPPLPSEEDWFDDLDGFEWARDAINRLAEAGIVKGCGARTFLPAGNIIRADFACMLVRTFNLTGEGVKFDDVPANAYYARELGAARSNGIVDGIGGNRFNPDGAITRQEMIVMMARALRRVKIELPTAQPAVLARFADASLISDYALEDIACMVQAGLIEGANGSLHPNRQATRAEAAVMLERILRMKEQTSDEGGTL